MSAGVRVGVLVSGRGSNLEALCAAAASPGFPARIALVISNRRDAGALEIAARRGIPAEVIPCLLYTSHDLEIGRAHV